jgi:eukaryotic-like serine/threonine-protein kinase
MGDRIGQQFGNYRLTRQLGRGGFAEVYLGEHVHIQTQAAIKILSAQMASSDLEHFIREARTIASLEQAHIVRVFDFGIQDEVPFLVMSYAPNGTLRNKYPRDTRVPLEDVLGYVEQVAGRCSTRMIARSCTAMSSRKTCCWAIRASCC